MPAFNLDNYETVEDRLVKFWADHEQGRIHTSVHYYDESRILVRAEVYFDREDVRPVASGYAEELRGASPVNRTSHAENAETSAIGRALANCGYAAKGSRPSREEMEKVQRGEQQPARSYPSVRESVEKSPPSQGQFQPKPKTPAPHENIINQLVEEGATVVEDPYESQNSSKSFAIKNPGESASPKQLGMLRAVLRNQGIIDNGEVITVCQAIVGREFEKLDHLTKGEASALITHFK
jgi:hypothetical protein